jgi:hypothetical protein
MVVQGMVVAKLGVIVLGKGEVVLWVWLQWWLCAKEDGPSGDEAPARKSGTKAGQMGRDGLASTDGSSVSMTGSRKDWNRGI